VASLQYYPDLVTLDYMRRQREFPSTETSDDAVLTDIIHGVSSDIIRLIERIPMPYVATKTFDYCEESIWNARTLYVDDDLLAVTTLTNAGSAISSSSYVLRPANQLPAYQVRLKQSATVWTYSSDVVDAVSIAGTWGYVPHYGREWLDSGIDVPAGGITSNATTVTVSDSSGFDTLGYIRINSEIMQITANDTDTNELTITRGELGTTAAGHSEGDAIETYVQLPDLVHDVSKIVGYLYKTLHDIGGQVQVFAGDTVAVERLDPSIVRHLKDKYRRNRPFIV